MNKEEIIIRRAEPPDADRLAAFGEKTFRDAFAALNNANDFEAYVSQAFSEEKIRSELADPASIFFLALSKGEWAGYAKLYTGDAPSCIRHLPSIEIARFYADKPFWGKGVAQALMRACEDFARSKNYASLWLGSWKKNSRGNAFYHKMGFKITGSATFALGSDIQEDHLLEKVLD